MIITKMHLSRRTFIRGTFGAAMALPFLDAMVPAMTAQSKTAAASPFRFGAIYMPNGVFPDTWHPDTAGTNFQFKPVMQPLEPFRDQLVTVSKMRAPWGS
jgi:secreted PhoX family phosphatase